MAEPASALIAGFYGRYAECTVLRNGVRAVVVVNGGKRLSFASHKGALEFASRLAFRAPNVMGMGTHDE